MSSIQNKNVCFVILLGGVQVVGITKSSATIQWTDGATNGRPISQYIISGRTTWNATWFNISES